MSLFTLSTTAATFAILTPVPAAPEPLSILGSVTAGMFGVPLRRKKLSRSLNL